MARKFLKSIHKGSFYLKSKTVTSLDRRRESTGMLNLGVEGISTDQEVKHESDRNQ
ncbi:MAG: hypothetical protein KME06_00770 [Kastovskya adunca ATA6-11-RM4]|jgi:hypothetical protein|nr:hypothetical protein [Kastovskya adunca ATA6-11-RM4]